MLHPLKKRIWNKRHWYALTTNWLLDHNSIACFPTKAHHSLSFPDVVLAFLT